MKFNFPYRGTSHTKILSHQTQVRVRFSEIDSMHIVWHGEYLRYFEDGREAFGRRYAGLSYMDIYQSGFTAPIADLRIQFKSPLTLNDIALIETRYLPTEAAKICFEYLIRRESDQQIVAQGHSLQVFLDSQNRLQLWPPSFYLAWKKRWGIE